MDARNLFIIFLILVVLLAVFLPLLVILALNTLFGLAIGYTLSTWFASLILLVSFGNLRLLSFKSE